MSEHYGATDECRIPNMGEGASEAYHAAGDEQDALLIDHEEVVTKAAGDKPTLAPVGSRLKRNMQIEYNRKLSDPTRPSCAHTPSRNQT